MFLRPNAPKMVTVLVAVALSVVGLALTVLPFDPIVDALRDAGVKLSKELRWLVLAASPTLLVVASFFKGL